MTFVEKGLVHLQYALGRLTSIFLVPLYFTAIRLRGYRIHDLERVRDEWSRFFQEHKGPWIVCANHLTMVDSVILAYTMLSLPNQIIRFHLVPWNLPERTNFQRNPLLTALCYLAKCIPIGRGGNRDEMRKTLERCQYILSRRQNLLIFPEGGRSRTGRVNLENYSYGVGRFVKACDGYRLLCVYLRGDRQETYGSIPRFGEQFTVTLEELVLQESGLRGLRAQRDYSTQIIQRVAKMEEDYFDVRRQ